MNFKDNLLLRIRELEQSLRAAVDAANYERDERLKSIANQEFAGMPVRVIFEEMIDLRSELAALKAENKRFIEALEQITDSYSFENKNKTIAHKALGES